MAAIAGTVATSLSAAHGLTPGVIRTWYPGLNREPRVLVPIELEVLMVRNTDQQWANCKMQTPTAESGSGDAPPQPAADLLPPPFSLLAQPRTRGAYLQWYLPKGLTSGTADSTANTAPNRWLVLRISQGSTQYRRAVTGWVLEAGIEPPVVTPLASWTEPGPAAGMQNPLTALALPTQAAISDAAYSTSGEWWPNATLLHGAVVGIDWPGNADTKEVGGPPNPANVQVVVGDTMAEAFGALIAQANSNADEAPTVEALQLGALAELDQPDGRARLDVQLHSTSFAGQSGGAATTEPFTVAPSGPPPTSPANPPPPPPGVFAETNDLGGGRVLQPVGAFGPGRFLEPRALGEMTVPSGRPILASSETFRAGGLSSIIGLLGAGVGAPTPDPGGEFEALRAVPRLFTPRDPCVLIQGGKRAFTHDSSVQTENGMVMCRLTPANELSWIMPDHPERLSVRGEDVLESGVNNGSVPIECDGLLSETVLLDSGSAATIAANVAQRTGGAFDVSTATLNARVEQTAWYALRNPHFDGAPLLARSGIAGTLPMPFAIAPVAHPWTPICLEWSVEFLPSPQGEKDWILGELDFVLNDSAVIPQPGTGIICSGRSTLTGGASNTLMRYKRRSTA